MGRRLRFSARHNARSARGSTLVERVGQLDLLTRERLVNGFGIESRGVRSGMGVNLRQTIGQPFENAEKCGRGHPPAFAETTDVIAESNRMTVQPPPRGSAQTSEDMAKCTAWRWLAHETHETEAVRASDGKRKPQDCWMKVQVRVSVPIRRGET